MKINPLDPSPTVKTELSTSDPEVADLIAAGAALVGVVTAALLPDDDGKIRLSKREARQIARAAGVLLGLLVRYIL